MVYEFWFSDGRKYESWSSNDGTAIYGVQAAAQGWNFMPTRQAPEPEVRPGFRQPKGKRKASKSVGERISSRPRRLV